MDHYNEDLIIAKRNIVSLHEGMKFFEIERQKDKQRVELLLNTVSDLTQQVQKLTIDLALLKAKSIGRGSTSAS